MNLNNGILILDFGSQYTELIARRLREGGVYCEIAPFSTPISYIEAKRPAAIVLSGGPSSVYERGAYSMDEGVFTLGVPLLGICYGMQYIAHFFGGKVIGSGKSEFGKARIELRNDETTKGQNSTLSALDGGLFSGCKDGATVWMSHADKVYALPSGFALLASSKDCEFAAIGNSALKIYGMQFHPEVIQSEEGAKYLQNFAQNIANITPDWDMGHFAEAEIKKLRDEIGDKKVLCAVSGGVDSSVVATLLHKAIGKNLVAIFVDHGLLRADEDTEVIAMFRDELGIDLRVVDARELFLERLAGVVDPEQKRKIIGASFIEVFDAEVKKLDLEIDYLAQGTLYPDIIESASGHDAAKTIKSHHNVGGLPKDMKLRLIEPLKALFKDEVRRLGSELGLSHRVLYRHPFPGPGLAIRIMGAVNKRDLETLKACDRIYMAKLREFSYYDKTWQAFCVLLNVYSVGVKGDNRSYDNTIALRAVDAIDGMTASFSHMPYEILEAVSTAILNEVDGINRVVYDISSKPPATIEWE